MAMDAFLYFAEIIKGETLDKVYKAKNAIQVYSFSWGESNPSTVGHGTGLSAGKVSISSLNVMKRVDAASTDLAQCCASGKHLTTATLVCRKAGGDKQIEFLTFTMKDVLVESVQWSGSSGGDDYPTESLSLSFAQVNTAYIPQKEDGSGDTAKKFGWNLDTNAAASE